MTDKELRKLSRRELLEMLIDQANELQALRDKLAEAENALQDRSVKIDQAGSIAEAALQLNGVFNTAQAACQQYMDNIRCLSERQEKICAQMEAESKAKAKSLVEAAEKKKADLEHDTQVQCAEMIRKAQVESQTYWEEVSRKLEVFFKEHAELRQLLSVNAPKK